MRFLIINYILIHFSIVRFYKTLNLYKIRKLNTTANNIFKIHIKGEEELPKTITSTCYKINKGKLLNMEAFFAIRINKKN